MDGGLVHIGRAQRNVVLDRPEEQPAILQDAADVAAQVRGIDLADVGAVDQDRAILRLVQVHHQPFHRRLAGADAADDADALARIDLEGDAIERQALLARILELDVAELDRPFDVRAPQEHLPHADVRSAGS